MERARRGEKERETFGDFPDQFYDCELLVNEFRQTEQPQAAVD